MPTNFSYTVDASSDIAERVKDAVAHTEQGAHASRIDRLREFQKHVNDLRQRGLLKKQEFVVTTTSDFERRYMRK